MRKGMSASDRRKRGTRIKQGLGDLVNLDAPRVDDQTGGPSVEVGHKRVHKRPRGDGSSDEVLDDRAAPQTVFEKDWSDWVRVRDDLCPGKYNSDSLERQQKALATVRSWMAKHRESVPLPKYVEATKLLVEAQLLDREWMRQTERGASSSAVIAASHVALCYGSAVSRVVHIMTGKLMTSKSFSKEGTTYRDRAQQLGFPEEAVEVRQRLAHGTQPSLHELRWVVAVTLQFIFETYWDAQSKHVDQLISQHAQRANLKAKEAARRAKKSKLSSVDEMKRLLEEIPSDVDVAVDDSSAPPDAVPLVSGCRIV